MTTSADRVGNLATGVLVVCAVVVTGLLVRRELRGPASEASSFKVETQSDWRNVAVGHELGPADAKVTIVEFADFECPYCRRFSQYVDSLHSLGRSVRVIYRHFPVGVSGGLKLHRIGG